MAPRSSRGSARPRVEAARGRQQRRRHEGAARRHRARKRRPDDRALADRCEASSPGRTTHGAIRARAAQRPGPLLALAPGQARRPQRAGRRLQLRGRRARARVRRLARAARGRIASSTSRPPPSAASSAVTQLDVRQGSRRAVAHRAAQRRSGRLVALASRVAGTHRFREAASSRRRPRSPSRSTTATRPSLARPRSPARAPRVDLFWPQTTPDAPDVVGDLIYQSYDLQEPIG